MEAPANLSEKLGTFTDRFSPRTVATYNNNDIMVAKLEGRSIGTNMTRQTIFFLSSKERSTSSCGIARLHSGPATCLWSLKGLSTGPWHAGRSTSC